MKALIILIVCVGTLIGTIAHPVIQKYNRATAETSFSTKGTIDDKDEVTMSDITQLLHLLKISASRDQQLNYSDAHVEGISFFNNLANKFRNFGKRMKHAFRVPTE